MAETNPIHRYGRLGISQARRTELQQQQTLRQATAQRHQLCAQLTDVQTKKSIANQRRSSHRISTKGEDDKTIDEWEDWMRLIVRGAPARGKSRGKMQFLPLLFATGTGDNQVATNL